MKRSLLLAFTLVAGISSAQNLPLWWSGATGSEGATEVASASVFDGNGNLYTLSYVGFESRVTKFSNTGSVVWTNSAPGLAFGLSLDAVGNPIVTGSPFEGFFNDLLLARFSAVNGTPDIRVIENPFDPAATIVGYSTVVDPVDGNIVVAGGLIKESQLRPYLFKFDKDTLAEVWHVGRDDLLGDFSRLEASGGRIYVGGTTRTGSVIVGYGSSTGDSLTTVVPTPDSTLSTELLSMTVVNDRLIWTGCTKNGFGSATILGEHFGQADFSPGSGNTFTQFSNPASGTFVPDVAYDASTGQLAFQVSSQTDHSVRFATINEATDGFDFGPTVSGSGRGVGLVPVTGGRFASYFQSSSEAPDQIGVSLLDPVLGKISGSFLGQGKMSTTTQGLPLASKSPVISLERATAINVATPTGARVYSLSYVAGPAADNRRFKEDASYTFNVLHNDPGVGAKLSYIVSNTAHGTVSLGLNGVAVYTPNANFHGTDSFMYHLYVDGVFASAETVTYNVLNVNDAPVAVADNLGTVGTALTILPLLDNDANVDGEASPLRYLSVTQPSNGTVTLANNKTALKIKAAPGQAGQPFSFTYTVQNGTGMTSTATVNGTF